MAFHHILRYISFALTQVSVSARVRTHELLSDPRASIALATGIAAPVLIMTVGMAVEVGRWAVVKGELQRAADMAAIAGANQYYAGLAAQAAANAAASVGELNGGNGGGSRSWNSTTQTLTDNLITVAVGPGLRSASNVGIKVTVARSVPLILTQLLGTDLTLNISASAWSELTSAQPCVLSLGQSSSGVTTQGNPSLSMTGCSVRSNSTISSGGSSTMTASSFWSKTSITGSGYTGTQHPNSGIIPNPYASDSAVNTALSKLSAGAGSSFSNQPNTTNSLSSGTYSGWNVQGRLNLNAGIYYVNGDISLGSQAILSGSGVTIISSGTLSMSGGATINLSAATTTNNAYGAIPGIVLAGNSTSSSSFGGNTGSAISGVIYYPNGALSFRGTSAAGTTGCLEVIANSVSLVGNSTMAPNCGGFGALTFGDASALGLVK